MALEQQKDKVITKQLGVSGRNMRLTNALIDEGIRQERCGHSMVPGQCCHKESLDKVRDSKNKLQKLSQERPFLDAYLQENQDKKLTASVNPKVDASNGRGQPFIFEMINKEGRDTIVKYKTLETFNQFPCMMKHLGQLNACVLRDNQIGKVILSSFCVSIKSLVTNYKYQKNFKLNQWIDICGYMKKQALISDQSPKQLVKLIVDRFERKALKDLQDNFDMSKINLQQYRKFFDSINHIDDKTRADVVLLAQMKKKIQVANSQFMKLQNRSKIINVDPIFNQPQYLSKQSEPLPVERYLVEISYP